MAGQVSSRPSSHWHYFQAEEVVRLLDVDLKTGLSGAEAKHRLEKFGPNVVRARRGTPAWVKFLQQFNQFAAVELEKWIRFGGRRGEHVIPE